ncbi:DUF2955 domain-containing protein [Ferrimonas sp.]|uniref:DUF2955 domain-containing protein n=1 Tax=Ferrimonas sp. TaxID=2080861 RepID=UPI003A8DEC48
MSQATDWNQVLRITGTVTLCMLLGRYLDFTSPVYLALFPVLAVTKARDYSWAGLVSQFFPALLASFAALITVELFSDHPYVVWALSLLLFDQLRKRATQPARIGALIMPVFNWVIVVVFAQGGSFDMVNRFKEILLSMIITLVVMKLFAMLFPPAPTPKGAPPLEKPISYRQRLNFVVLLGLGQGFLMMVDMLSATFCMVPLILAAAQVSHDSYLKVLRVRFITQVGGCALAMIFMVLLLGHQTMIPFYGLALGLLILAIAYQIGSTQGPDKDLHGDALLGVALPIQLYVGPNQFGLADTLQRGWQLTLVLLLLLTLGNLLYHQRHHEQNHHRHSGAG